MPALLHARRSVAAAAAFGAALTTGALGNPTDPATANWQGPCYNCYNYATNIRVDAVNNYFCQPGQGSGMRYQLTQCDSDPGPPMRKGVKDAAIADGLMFLGNPAAGQPVPAAPAGKCIVALAIRPANPGMWSADYHWYRLNDVTDNTVNPPVVRKIWSDKPGETPAKIFGANGMTAPHDAAAARGRYTVFCGYFAVDPAMPPTLRGTRPRWALPAGMILARLENAGTEDPRSQYATTLALGSLTPTGGPLSGSAIPPEPDLALVPTAGCSAIIGSAESLSFVGMSGSGPKYLRAFTVGSSSYIAAYPSAEDPVLVSYYLDDRGMGSYICSLVAPSPVPTVTTWGLLALGTGVLAAGVLVLRRVAAQ